MEIILKKYHKGLGEKNDVVTVKPGFARNFLIPQGIAVLATASSKKVLAEEIKQAAHRVEHLRKEALAIAAKLEEMTLSLEAHAGPDGRLFGSITTQAVAQALEAKGIVVDRQRIAFEGPVKTTGIHNASIDLHKEVKATLKVEVVASAK